MALTEQARKSLNAKIVGHEGVANGVVLASGLTKISGGLVARPSTDTTNTRTGALVDASDQPIAEQPEAQPQPQQPVIETVPVEQSRKKTRGGRKTSEPARAVRVELEIQGIGILPSQYTHCYVGTGVVVLGLNEYSYVPAEAHYEGDRLMGVIQLKIVPGRYGYLGNSFTDSSGIRNIILAEIKEESYDGEELG
jgi:hypothetical protein